MKVSQLLSEATSKEIGRKVEDLRLCDVEPHYRLAWRYGASTAASYDAYPLG